MELVKLVHALAFFLYLTYKCFFQELEAKMFLSRHATKRNNLYFTSKLVRNLMQSNADRVKIINAGVKSFAKCENKGANCNFR